MLIRINLLKILIGLLCLFSFGSINVSGQEIKEHYLLYKNTRDNETKVKSALAISENYLTCYKTDSAKFYCKEAIRIARNHKYAESLCEGYILQGRIEHFKPNFQAADSLYIIAYGLAESNYKKAEIILLSAEINKRKDEIDSLGVKLMAVKEILADEPLGPLTYEYHHKMAVYYIKKDRIYEGIKELLYLRSITDKGLVKKHLSINYTLAWTYQLIDANQAAIPILLDNLSINKKSKDYVAMMGSYFGLAGAYSSLEQYEDVKRICFKALKLHEEHKISTSFGFIYSCLGGAYTHQDNPDSAIFYLNKGLSISRLQNEPKELSDNLLGLSEAYFSKGEIDKSEEFANQTIHIKGFTSIENLEILSKISESNGNFEKALEYKNLILTKNNNQKSYARAYKIITEIIQENNEEEAKATKTQSEIATRVKLMKFLAIFIGVIALVFIYVFTTQKRTEKELKSLNDKLLSKNSALQHFSYICSHDLKEPIRTISSFSGLIENKLTNENLENDYQEYFSFIRNSVDSVSNTINSLHLFTEINKKQEYTLEKVSVSDLIHKVHSNLKTLIDEKNVLISFSNNTNLDFIVCSEISIALILQNLIQNGIKYNISSPPKIDITLNSKGEELFFRIIDNGIGISKEFLQYIFLPFKTLDSKSKTGSSGLGLAICSQLASNLEGRIEVESELNTGSVFTLYFKKNQILES